MCTSAACGDFEEGSMLDPRMPYESQLRDHYNKFEEFSYKTTPFRDEVTRAMQVAHSRHRVEMGEFDDISRPPDDFEDQFNEEGKHFYLSAFGFVVTAPDDKDYVMTQDEGLAEEVQNNPMPGTLEGSEVTTADGETSVLVSVNRLPELAATIKQDQKEDEEDSDNEGSDDENETYGDDADNASSMDYMSLEEVDAEIKRNTPPQRAPPPLPPRPTMLSAQQIPGGMVSAEGKYGFFDADLGVYNMYQGIVPAGRKRFRGKKGRRTGRSRHTKGAKAARTERKKLKSSNRSKKREIAKIKKENKRKAKREAREAKEAEREEKEIRQRERQIKREEEEGAKLDAELAALRGESAGSEMYSKSATSTGAAFPKSLVSVPVAMTFGASGNVSSTAPKDNTSLGKKFHSKLLGHNDSLYAVAEAHALEAFHTKYGISAEKATRNDDGSYVLKNAFKIEPYAIKGDMDHKIKAVRGFAGDVSAGASIHEGGWRLTITNPSGAKLGGTWGGKGGTHVQEGAVMRTGKWHVDDEGGYGNSPVLVHFVSSTPMQIEDGADSVGESFDVDFHDPINPKGLIYFGTAERTMSYVQDPTDKNAAKLSMNTEIRF
jgi:hypothetical protein